jgi:hypothetical protein
MTYQSDAERRRMAEALQAQAQFCEEWRACAVMNFALTNLGTARIDAGRPQPKFWQIETAGSLRN